MLELFSLLLLEFLSVGSEFVEQVVDDVCREYLHTELVCQLLGVALDLINGMERS